MPGSNGDVDGHVNDTSDFGHAFIAFEAAGNQEVIGFYPKTPINFPGDAVKGKPGNFLNDRAHPYELEATFDVTQEQFEAAEKYASDQRLAPPTWYNRYWCSDFAMGVVNAAGQSVSIPVTTEEVGPWMYASGRFPGRLAVELKSHHGGKEVAMGDESGSSSASKAKADPEPQEPYVFP